MAVRSRLTGRPATVVDSLGGAAVNVVAVLIVAWLHRLVPGQNAPFPAIARQVNNSVVLRTVDSMMPRRTLYLPVFPPAAQPAVATGSTRQVFSAIGAEN